MSWMSWQIDYLLLLQNFRNITNGIFDNFFLFISQLGVMPFTIIVICAVYWGFNKKLGAYMLYCYCFSYLMNIFLKFTACIYRPWIIDSRVHPTAEALSTAPGYSFPSGHTAGAVSFWGSIAVFFKKNRLISCICLLIIFLVMLSRNYLGVHTPQDVIVSFIVGIILVFAVEKMFKWKEGKSNGESIIIAGLTVICILLATYLTLKSYPVDYKDGVILYDVTDAKLSALARIVNLYAIFLGFFLETKFIKFEPVKGSILRKILFVFIGIAIFFIIEYPLLHLLNNITDAQTAKCIIRFLNGFFITFIFPCFIKLTDRNYAS